MDELTRLRIQNARYRDALLEISKHPTQEEIGEGQFCDFGHAHIAKDALVVRMLEIEDDTPYRATDSPNPDVALS
jgi:hypothetical protein